jgi:LacI family transcriptional regulator
MATIAEAAGVSISTVSRIVNGQTQRASPATIARVRRAIDALGYRPNQIGLALKRGRSRLVAMLTAELANPVMATIASATEAALRDAGYVMVLCDTHDLPDLQDEYLLAMRAQAVEGYVLVTNLPSPGLAEFVARGEPMVFACRRNPYAASHSAGAFIGIDNTRAGRDAADHLLERGCPRVAILSPAEGSHATTERAEGCRTRLLERGMAPEQIHAIRAPGHSHLEIGYAGAEILAAGGPWQGGIACVSDQIAFGIYRFAQERGLDLVTANPLISIDGADLSAWLAPWLSSVRVPYQEFGGHILEMLQTLWHGQPAQDRIIPYTLRPATAA